jgi:hypothetical protein
MKIDMRVACLCLIVALVCSSSGCENPVSRDETHPFMSATIVSGRGEQKWRSGDLKSSSRYGTINFASRATRSGNYIDIDSDTYSDEINSRYYPLNEGLSFRIFSPSRLYIGEYNIALPALNVNYATVDYRESFSAISFTGRLTVENADNSLSGTFWFYAVRLVSDGNRRTYDTLLVKDGRFNNIPFVE